MSTKNPIKEQLESFYDELTEARKCCQKLMRTLSSSNDESEIKILIQKIPNFNFLKEQSAFIKEQLRKVCSGELSPQEAEKIIQKIYLEILDAMTAINSNQL